MANQSKIINDDWPLIEHSWSFYCHYFLETIKIIHSTANNEAKVIVRHSPVEKAAQKRKFTPKMAFLWRKKLEFAPLRQSLGKTFKSERNWVKFLRRSRLDWPKFSLQNFWHGKIQHKFMLKSYYQIRSWSLNFGVKLHFGGNIWEAFHELS